MKVLYCMKGFALSRQTHEKKVSKEAHPADIFLRKEIKLFT